VTAIALVCCGHGLAARGQKPDQRIGGDFWRLHPGGGGTNCRRDSRSVTGATKDVRLKADGARLQAIGENPQHFAAFGV